MRRGTIGLTAVAAALTLFPPALVALERTGSAAGNSVPQLPVPQLPVSQLPVSAASDVGVQGIPQVVTEAASTAYGIADSVADSGWRLALGAYYFGGELLDTGRILASNAAALMGAITVDTEPGTLSSETPASTSAEDRRVGVWSDTGQSDHTPGLDIPARNGESVVASRKAALPVATAAANAKATRTPAAPPLIERVALGGAAPTPSTAATADTTCNWPALGMPENADSESATFATLSELRLMSEPSIRLPDGTVFMPKVAQRLLQIRTGFPCRGGVTSSRKLVGHVIADPTASGLVQASQDGRVEAADWGLPRLGQRVVEGEVLGYLRPIWSNRDRASMEAEIASLRGQVAGKELELARSRELPLLPFREGRILSIRLELDQLRRHRDALIEGLDGTEPLVASANGVIARADVRVGQVVEARHLLWEIVNENRLWVEADWFGGNLPKVQGASATRTDGGSLPLSYEGSGWAQNEQSTPLQFRVQRPVSGLRVGERVTVLIHEPVTAYGVLVPRSALVRRGNGETAVWAATSAERFESHRVRWKPVDGSTVAIEAGLPDGARVVLNGAGLLSEVR